MTLYTDVHRVPLIESKPSRPKRAILLDSPTAPGHLIQIRIVQRRTCTGALPTPPACHSWTCHSAPMPEENVGLEHVNDKLAADSGVGVRCLHRIGMTHCHCATLQEGLVVVRTSQKCNEAGSQIFRRQGHVRVPLENCSMNESGRLWTSQMHEMCIRLRCTPDFIN